MNFGQMIGEVSSWNPNASIPQIQTFINNATRKVNDRRLWYGNMVKGQIVTPAFYSQGTVSVTLGSASVQGIGSSFTTAMIGSSLRVGYIAPIYNIVAVDPIAQVLTLELPWGNPTMSSVGYFIAKYYYLFGNIKYLKVVTNLQLQYRLWTGLTQETLDTIDPSRQQLIYPRAVASMPPAVTGEYQAELWPASLTQQALPYIGYVQTPNLVDDTDTLPPFMRCDIVANQAISDALLWRPKDNPNYSEATAITIAKEKRGEFEAELLRMEWADEQLTRQDIINRYEQYPFPDLGGGGAMLDAMSPVSYLTGGRGFDDGW